MPRPIVAVVVQQHAEEAALLRQVRSVLVRAPHVSLGRLGRLDERLAAHLDGLAVAGPAGRAMCLAALERPGAGEVFALAVLALEAADLALIDRLLALWVAVPDARRGLVSACGWVSPPVIGGVLRGLLASPPGPALELGIEACRLHRLDPGVALHTALASPVPALQLAAARSAGELGRRDLLPALLQPRPGEPEDLVFWTAWSACLLGDRHQALTRLAGIAAGPGPWSDRALALVIAAGCGDAGDGRASAAAGWASELAHGLSQAARAPGAGLPAQRRLIRALALLGELRFVPWLIARMSEPELTRLAGEAFHWITGADLALLDLETLDPPPGLAPPDAAEDDGVLDDDDSLPWPDPVRVQSWWDRERAGLEQAAAGGRLFLGRPISTAHTHQVLVEGTQRQRAHAACLAAVLQPGRPVFQVAAPASRQRRELAAMPA